METLLELSPEAGIEAWLDLLSDCEDDLRTPPIGMLLVSADRAAPADVVDRFPTADRMSKAIAELVLAAPEARTEAALAAIELGHRPTMVWAITDAEASLDQRVLEALLDRALRSSRPGLEELALQASRGLAAISYQFTWLLPQPVIGLTDSPTRSQPYISLEPQLFAGYFFSPGGFYIELFSEELF